MAITLTTGTHPAGSATSTLHLRPDPDRPLHPNVGDVVAVCLYLEPHLQVAGPSGWTRHPETGRVRHDGRDAAMHVFWRTWTTHDTWPTVALNGTPAWAAWQLAAGCRPADYSEGTATRPGDLRPPRPDTRAQLAPPSAYGAGLGRNVGDQV